MLEDLPSLPSLIRGTPGTVPMARSNSLPVLTLRELHALKQKYGGVGIVRGGEWAWVSRADQVSSSSTSNGPTCNDPFAPETSYPPTTPDYHYTPSNDREDQTVSIVNDSRRPGAPAIAVPISHTPSPRHKITRYKSLPGGYHGLGLSIVVPRLSSRIRILSHIGNMDTSLCV